MSKSKTELIKEAKGYFKKYPKAGVIYTTGDGNFFLESNLSAAKTHAKQQKEKLKEIHREEVEGTTESKKTDKDPVVIPEGEPSKEWTKDQLIAYGEQTYPDVKLTKQMKEDTLLEKLAEAKAAEEAKE